MLVRLSDGTGFITLRFFHFSNSQKQAMQRGQWVRCFGDIKAYNKSSGVEVVHPEYQFISEQQRGQIDDGLLAVYPVPEALKQTSVRQLIKQVFAILTEGATVREVLPQHAFMTHDYPKLIQRLAQLH